MGNFKNFVVFSSDLCENKENDKKQELLWTNQNVMSKKSYL